MKRKRLFLFLLLGAAVLLAALLCLFVGSSHMSLPECAAALFGKGSAADIRIMRSVRVPRVLAALIAGAGLSVSGLVMQTVLNNPMASPSTLGVSNAAVFGANLSILAFAGDVFSSAGATAAFSVGIDPFSTGLTAFLFAALSVGLILGMCRLKSFEPGAVVLAGIAMGSVWTAAVTVLQFYATDAGLSAAVIWNFGDLGRATYETDLIMLFAAAAIIVFAGVSAWKFNALLSGAETAASLGVNVKALRFVSLLLSSLVTAVCVSSLGIIGFVGIICPHAAKKLFGADHRVSVPSSALCGSILLLSADALARSVGRGSALPVGAVTSLLGAPFFVGLIIGKRGKDRA